MADVLRYAVCVVLVVCAAHQQWCGGEHCEAQLHLPCAGLLDVTPAFCVSTALHCTALHTVFANSHTLLSGDVRHVHYYSQLITHYWAKFKQSDEHSRSHPPKSP